MDVALLSVSLEPDAVRHSSLVAGVSQSWPSAPDQLSQVSGVAGLSLIRAPFPSST